MKKLLIIISYKTLRKIVLFLAAAAILTAASAYWAYISRNDIPVSSKMEVAEIKSLVKENSKLEGILKSIVPKSSKIIYEDRYRNQYQNVPGFTPPAVRVYPIKRVLEKGSDMSYQLLSDNPSYLRPVFDPAWKDAYYRGWLDLCTKNVEARHRLFIYPGGGSSIYDFTGSLGFNAGTAVDYQKNINFLIYDFKVKSIKWYEHQAVLVGEPQRRGSQVVSVVQDYLLAKGADTSDILFHLCTPGGYELDFIYGSVIRYTYLKKIIEENTVKRTDANLEDYKTIEQLVDKNLALQKELSNFIPMDNSYISQDMCRPIPPNYTYDGPDIETVKKKALSLPFHTKYSDNAYSRPVYDPLWLKNYKKRWCYIPQQVCNSLHTLFLIPESRDEQKNFFGTLGFNENFKPVNADEWVFLVYNAHIEKVSIYNSQILISGTPSLTGAEIIAVKRSYIPANQSYVVRLITPDDQETDYTILDNY